MHRVDLSTRLIHLTRGPTPDAARTAFQQILEQGKLIGSSNDIRGKLKCVCFTEAPLSALAQVLAAKTEDGMRYAPFGVAVGKNWLFEQGGRPVIYQTNDEYDFLHEKQRFRHVRYEPSSGRDFTWEREWRIQKDYLQINPYESTFIVPSRKWVDEYQMKHIEEQVIANRGSSMLIVQPPKWHFIVIEDIGVSIPLEA